MSKHLHPGKAAFNGVLSADLARAGFTGARRILEGDRGFFRAMSAAHDETPDHRRTRRAMEDQRELLQGVGVLRAHALGDRRRARPSRAARLERGRGGVRDIAADAHRDLRPRLRDREGEEPDARRMPPSSASRTASPPRCSTAARRWRSFPRDRFSNDGFALPTSPSCCIARR